MSLSRFFNKLQTPGAGAGAALGDRTAKRGAARLVAAVTAADADPASQPADASGVSEGEEDLFDLGDKAIAEAIDVTAKKRARAEEAKDKEEADDDVEHDGDDSDGDNVPSDALHADEEPLAEPKQKRKTRGPSKRKPSVVHVMYVPTKQAGKYSCLLSPYTEVRLVSGFSGRVLQVC